MKTYKIKIGNKTYLEKGVDKKHAESIVRYKIGRGQWDKLTEAAK